MTAPLVLDPNDDVAILAARTEIKGRSLASGHKIARRAISPGDPIRKFGQLIGFATAPIAAGDHVHSHNLAFGDHQSTARIGENLAEAEAAVPNPAPRQFDGFHRDDGRIGTRNMIALLATVNCSATVIRRAAEKVRQSGLLKRCPNVDDVIALSHGTGCGIASEGPGWENLQRVLWGHATHPNVGAAVFVGLGCEMMQIARMKAMYGDGNPERFHGITIQESGGTEATIDRIVAQVSALLPYVNRTGRAPAPASALTVALQCGGSDGLSGITANPALGSASDRLVGLGGAVILSETPEIYGAEDLLLRRARSQKVGAALQSRLQWWEEYTRINGATMDNNPSPGNKAGGLTTILEKSLGAVAKAGATPLEDVLAYGEKLRKPGLNFMDTPGFDPVSVTGQIAGGAQIVVFTTGRGSAFGSKPAPTIKLATNDHLMDKMAEDMDVACGDILSDGIAVADKGEEILDLILATASGRATKSEGLGLGDNEFLPWQIGAVM